MTARWACWPAITAAWCSPVPELVEAVFYCMVTFSAQHVHSRSCTVCRAQMRRKQLAYSRPAQMAQACVMPLAQTWQHPLVVRSPSLMKYVPHWLRHRKMNISVDQPKGSIQSVSARTSLLPF